MESLLKILRLNNAPTVPVGDDEIIPEADEPPDDQVPELTDVFRKESVTSRKTSVPSLFRRESLLTRAIQGETDSAPASPRLPYVPRGMSTTSSHSFASTAELTSDVESPLRSASPSPPPPLHRHQLTPTTKDAETAKVVIAPVAHDDKDAIGRNGEAAVEKTLGRKRCIMFACNDSSADVPKKTEMKAKAEEPVKVEPAPRRPRITFACPTRPSDDSTPTVEKESQSRRQSSLVQAVQRPSIPPSIQTLPQRESTTPVVAPDSPKQPEVQPLSPQHAFHEFASSHDEADEWVVKSTDATKPKLTIDDCLKKELAIRKLGKEAEEEAEEEEREQDALDNEYGDEDAVEDDFAPSDDGNESDNEEGFADSDSESDANSEYSFWAPSNAIKATSNDNMTHFSARQHSRSRASSTSSGQSLSRSGTQARLANKVKATRAIKMRPGTPELPDSTDFVCGTLDEDRPLEAAYISCREQKRREKHIPIPQDIDPSFPTTDPEDEEDDDDDDAMAESSDHLWIKNQFEDFDEEVRGRRPSAFLVSPLHSPAPVAAPPRPSRPTVSARPTLRSPPPSKQGIAKSPAPRRLFDRPLRRVMSPPPTGRLRSPRGSPTSGRPTPFGITINHLAQRPNADRISSLPHTPNPFFRNWKNGSQPISRITSGANTPGIEELHPDLHVRGPVDIVIGLEKKRQKRKEKFWRQHCRKLAKEQAVKRPPPGRGAERMKELGLECAERTRGYGLGQPAHLVLSL